MKEKENEEMKPIWCRIQTVTLHLSIICMNPFETYGAKLYFGPAFIAVRWQLILNG
jgi:hypothetical protein